MSAGQVRHDGKTKQHTHTHTAGSNRLNVSFWRPNLRGCILISWLRGTGGAGELDGGDAIKINGLLRCAESKSRLGAILCLLLLLILTLDFVHD